MNETRAERRKRRRDRRRAKRKVNADPRLNRFLRSLAIPPIKWFFNVHAVNAEVLRNTRPPFLVMGNHSSVWDPFFLHAFVHAPVHYVVSDSQFRSKLLGTALGLVGAIPKTKALSDLETVKNIVTIKHNKGIIGVFPEGQSSWDGHSLPIVKSTFKLIKSLKVPVITARIQGAYLSWPRWAPNARRGRVQVTYELAFSPEELRGMSLEQVEQRLIEHLHHDEFDYQQKARTRYRGRRFAEYLERVLFVCPECRSLHTLVSHRRRLRCTACGHEVSMTPYGRFEARRGPLHFETVREWNVWQSEFFREWLVKHQAVGSASGTEPRFGIESGRESETESGGKPGRQGALMIEPAVKVAQGYKTQPLVQLGVGQLELFGEHLCALRGTPAERVFRIADIEGINIQNNEHLEFYVGDDLYRITTVSPRGNTYKWDLAVRTLQTAQFGVGGQAAAT